MPNRWSHYRPRSASDWHQLGTAPVVDINNNPDNPVINVRALKAPAEVIYLASAFIRGAKAYPVLTTAKHFPGHGDTATDSHLDLPVLPHHQTDWLIELPPFKAAIALWMHL